MEGNINRSPCCSDVREEEDLVEKHLWEQGDSDNTEHKDWCAVETAWRRCRFSADKGWNSNHLPFAYKQSKVMYLIRIVGTRYQQEEPREGVVGWTWKTGSISLWKGEKKEGWGKWETVSVQGEGNWALSQPVYVTAIPWANALRVQPLRKVSVKSFEVAKAVFIPVRKNLNQFFSSCCF